ncbi:CigA protein [Mucor mucedo]|uniref:CigA protein n=1 Tax=Mucor mucedo TaxID=29922 RepID=UPI00222006A3|nr:CigA protein [Mucor mucedo]KAI7896887.1 CigA protein [Mucor mucedo]
MDSLLQKRSVLVLLLLVCCVLFYVLLGVEKKDTFIDKVEQDKKKAAHASSVHIVKDNVLPVEFPSPFQLHTPTKDEKFITYLPHSGFHNQRIELENALLLASYLNRTLLLPSVYLGNPAFPWLRFDKMYERLLLQTKNGLSYCSELREGEPLSTECLNYFRWTAVPWTFFYDLQALNRKVRIVFRQDLSLEWLNGTLQIDADDTYLFKDNSPFDFRVYDLPESKTPLTRFVNRIDLSTLESIKEKLIHFGSVFGTSRVLAQSKEHAELLQFIRQEMIFKNPVLVDTAAKVVQQLGGVGQFVGIHLRVGDGMFKTRASIAIDDIYHQLVDDYTDLSIDGVMHYDEEHDEDRKENTEYEIKQLRESNVVKGDDAKPITVNHPSDIQSRLGRSQLPSCQVEGDGMNDRFAKTTIFIATDCPNPREHPLLRKIFRTFPCTFVLADFKKDLMELSKIEVVDEKVKLNPWLIPMVDAIIASQGHTFFGTNSSTFSTYIERQLHPVYTNQHAFI